MLWRYIGCNITLVPKELLGKTNKMSKNEVKELLNSIPLEEGVLEAPNIDHLVRQLMAESVFPIKIRPCDRMDERLEKLKSYRSRVTMSTVKVGEDILKVIPMQKSKKNWLRIILLVLLFITLVIGIYVVYTPIWFT